MKIRMLLLTMFIAAITTILNCGSNVATSGSTITVVPTSITWNSLIPYVTNPIYTTVSSSAGVPMNGIQVKYYAALSVGGFSTASTGFFAFFKNDTVCPSPCEDTTNSNGMSIMNVIFCMTSDCSSVTPVQLPNVWPTTTTLTYTDTIYVSSGTAPVVQIPVKINGQ
jgi:hypothetical protein